VPAVSETIHLTLEDAAARVRDRRVSPAELTEACLARIEKVDPRLNAFVTVTAEVARAQAHEATDEIAAGRYRGPLHGIPVAVKDLFATKGIRTTAGSRILADWVPEADATVVRKLREAGAVLLGKLGLHEFARRRSRAARPADRRSPSSPARRTPRSAATPEEASASRPPSLDVSASSPHSGERVSSAPFRLRGRSTIPARSRAPCAMSLLR